MKLASWEWRKTGRRSVVDALPDGLREQLIEARLAGTHSVGSMIEWLHNDEEIHTDDDVKTRCEAVTASALSGWFQSRGHRAGSGRGDA